MPLAGEVEIDAMDQNAGPKGVSLEDGEQVPRRRANNRRGRGTMETDRPPIVGLVERGGCMRLRVLENGQKKTIEPVIQELVQAGSRVYTDEYSIYNDLPLWSYRHGTVNHRAGEYAHGRVHCNTIEGIWSLVRHWLRVDRGVSKMYLKYYVAIIEFFYNLKRISRPPLAALFQVLC